MQQCVILVIHFLKSIYYFCVSLFQQFESFVQLFQYAVKVNFQAEFFLSLFYNYVRCWFSVWTQSMFWINFFLPLFLCLRCSFWYKQILAKANWVWTKNFNFIYLFYCKLHTQWLNICLSFWNKIWQRFYELFKYYWNKIRIILQLKSVGYQLHTSVDFIYSMKYQLLIHISFTRW